MNYNVTQNGFWSTEIDMRVRRGERSSEGCGEEDLSRNSFLHFLTAFFAQDMESVEQCRARKRMRTYEQADILKI